jgi:hypothetical protein
MPSIAGYNPGGSLWRRRWGHDVNDEPIANPDGIFSGMTQGLAVDGEPFADVSDMPPDSRSRGTLFNQNKLFNDTADPDPHDYDD